MNTTYIHILTILHSVGRSRTRQCLNRRQVLVKKQGMVNIINVVVAAATGVTEILKATLGHKSQCLQS